MERKTALQILEETVQYYSEDTNRRSINKGSTMCMYKGENGNVCAYARCWKEGVYKEEYELRGVKTLSRLEGSQPDDLVKEEYQGHPVEFWYRIQNLHDSEYNWNTEEGEGLTPMGISEVECIKELIERNNW